MSRRVNESKLTSSRWATLTLKGKEKPARKGEACIEKGFSPPFMGLSTVELVLGLVGERLLSSLSLCPLKSPQCRGETRWLPVLLS